jgi:hypothetical protein
LSTPLQLVDLLGEGWCITLTRGSVLEALSGMEVDPEDVRLNVASPSTAVPAGADPAAVPVTLLARDVGDGLTLVLEVDGRTGWVGAQPDVLETLSANGGMACTATKNPNREQVLYAADGVVLVGFDPATARRWGASAAYFDQRLDAAGFPGPDGEGGTDDILQLSPTEGAAVAMEVMVGIRLNAGMFAGPWAVGPSTR